MVAYLKLASATGARPGEMCALRRKNIDLECCTIRIELSADRISLKLKRPKSRWSVRILQLAPELIDSIAEPSAGRPGGLPLPVEHLQRCKVPTALLAFQKCEEKARRSDRAARDQAHHAAFVPTLRSDGAPRAEGKSPAQVARYLGHANDSLVRTLYGAHIVDDAQREIGEAASRLV